AAVLVGRPPARRSRARGRDRVLPRLGRRRHQPRTLRARPGQRTHGDRAGSPPADRGDLLRDLPVLPDDERLRSGRAAPRRARAGRPVSYGVFNLLFVAAVAVVAAVALVRVPRARRGRVLTAT